MLVGLPLRLLAGATHVTATKSTAGEPLTKPPPRCVRTRMQFIKLDLAFNRLRNFGFSQKYR